MKKVLHIHQDYPDGRDYPFTMAVSNLLKACRDQNPDVVHYVLSINRTSNPFKVSLKKFEDGVSLVYWALPLPLIYKPIIWFWSMIIAYVLRGESFSTIHGHKLTTEGLFSYFLANRLAVPFVISIRGGSDANNLARLKNLSTFFSKVYYSAAHVFWVSVWAKKNFSDEFNGLPSNSTDLPNICEISDIPQPQVGRERYCIILSYHQLYRKGLFPLLEALVLLRDKGQLIRLDIIGSGSEEECSKITAKIAALHLEDQVNISGQLSHLLILDTLSRSKGLLLPAINETFGMAYVEALACQCPILYMANTGIDGYLDDVKVGAKLDTQTASCIASGILKIELDYANIAHQLAKINQTEYLGKFTAANISQQYLNRVKDIINC